MKPDADPAPPLPDGPPPPRSKRKLVLFGAPVLVCVLGAALWFTGVLPGLLGMGGAVQSAFASPPAFLDLPEIVANLNGSPRKPSYLKLHAKLQLANASDVAAVDKVMPRVMDLFQTFLRETRPEELHGSTGTYRLREELIARSSLAAAPVRVQDVLFTEILIQ